MKRSTAALIIAILFHLLIILSFLLLGAMMPEIKKVEPKKEEERIRISLKERPKPTKETPAEESKVKQPEIAPPMPKGKQLERLVQKPFKKVPDEPTPVQRPKPITKLPVQRKEPPKPQPPKKKEEPLPPKKTDYIPPEKVEEALQKNKPQNEEHSKLYAFLSKQVLKQDPSKKKQPKERASRISEDIKEAYGTQFGKLSAGELQYILDNQEIMRRITQQVLNRVGSVNIPNDFRINSHNIVEFHLHPNGDISDLRIVKKSGFYLLDDTTKETIEYAYSKYPAPEQKTLIRYKVGYYLRGY